MAVEGVSGAPEGLVLREAPEATEAVLECTMATLGATGAFAYDQWLPQSEYECAEPLPWYEKYPPGGGEGPDMRVEIHIAVRKAGS